MYNTPDSDMVLLKVVKGTVQVSGVSTGNIVIPDIYVGSARKLVVHVLDGVIVTYNTAERLGVLRNQ